MRCHSDLRELNGNPPAPGKGAPAYLVIALIPTYSTLFLMAPRHLDRSKLMVFDLRYTMTNNRQKL